MRLQLKQICCFVCLLACFMLIVFGLANKAMTPSFNEEDYTIKTVRIYSGDTLSALAYEYKAPDCDWRAWANAVMQLNHIGANLVAGDVIKVYVYNK